MNKLTTDFIIKQYQSGVDNYADFTTEVGLWASEQYVFEKYIKKDHEILDVGCGTGRTTFHLYQMGFQKIRGIDLTPEMVLKAKELNSHFQVEIAFTDGDVRKLEFKDASFDVVLFSFNGMMSIPHSREREKGLKEIYRVLKDEGIFIFTTHDREKDAKYFDFWKEQQIIWESGKQDAKLYEFGDLITSSNNEESKIFIHIPNHTEVESFLDDGGFEVLESFYRSDKFNESEKVKEKSGECRFWIARKKHGQKKNEKN